MRLDLEGYILTPRVYRFQIMLLPYFYFKHFLAGALWIVFGAECVLATKNILELDFKKF